MSEQKDQFDAHYKLAEFYKQVRNERRQHEWRVTLALWVGLAAGAAGMVSVKILPNIPRCIVIAFLVLVLIYHCGWAMDNFRLRNRDADRSYAHLAKASEFTGLSKVDPPNQKWWERYPLFEAGGTMLLIFGFVIIYVYH
jgi:hypothetical protein